MTRLEDLRPHATVRGILPDGAVAVVSGQWYGSVAVELPHKEAAGRACRQAQCEDVVVIAPNGVEVSFPRGQRPVNRFISWGQEFPAPRCPS